MQGTTELGEGVNYRESLAYAVAKTLRDRGYGIAGCSGIRQTEPNHDFVGILKQRSPIKRSLLGLHLKRKQAALHIGTLWLDNESRGAKPDENWVLEVYGRDNVTKLTELIKEFSESSHVKVQVRLDSENPKVETYFSDHDYDL